MIKFYKQFDKAFAKKQDECYLVSRRLSAYGNQVEEFRLVSVFDNSKIVDINNKAKTINKEFKADELWNYTYCSICHKPLIMPKKTKRKFCYKNGEYCKTFYNNLKKYIDNGLILDSEDDRLIWGFAPKRGKAVTPRFEDYEMVQVLDSDNFLNAKEFFVKFRTHKAKISIIPNNKMKNKDDYVFVDAWDNNNYIVITEFERGSSFVDTFEGVLTLVVRMVVSRVLGDRSK